MNPVMMRHQKKEGCYSKQSPHSNKTKPKPNKTKTTGFSKKMKATPSPKKTVQPTLPVSTRKNNSSDKKMTEKKKPLDTNVAKKSLNKMSAATTNKPKDK